jgi:putative hydrolase of the HAD superfamily
MRYPKMILFDYGRTLLYEPGFDTLAGERALFEKIVDNPRGVTPEQAEVMATRIFAGFAPAREAGMEIHEHAGMRLKNEWLGLTFSVSMEEAETIFWDHASGGAMMPGVQHMLSCLAEKGIRSGVISNIGWSGHALSKRIQRLLPDSRFEFVIASSEYGIRKPNRMLFELALRKAGLEAHDVWFCGDHPQYDVEGAAGAGLYPVWYDNDTVSDDTDRSGYIPPRCDHLHIREWDELVRLLELT